MFRSHDDHASKIRCEVERHDDSSAPKNYACNLCTKTSDSHMGYESETEVELHKQNHHTIHKVVMPGTELDHKICLVCAITFPIKGELVSHIKTAHLYSSKDARRVERAIYVCDACHRIFFNKDMLAVHLWNKHKTFEQRHPTTVCPHCKKTVQRASLWYHFEARGLKSISTCPFCFKRARNTAALREHIATHPYHYRCDVCNYDTMKKAFYVNHLQTYHKSTVRPLKFKKEASESDDCKRYFFGPSKTHWWFTMQYVVVNGISLFGMVKVCILCREICTSQREMERHVADVHTGAGVKVKEEKKRLECSCGEQFSNMILLKHHIFKTQGEHKAV